MAGFHLRHNLFLVSLLALIAGSAAGNQCRLRPGGGSNNQPSRTPTIVEYSPGPTDTPGAAIVPVVTQPGSGGTTGQGGGGTGGGGTGGAGTGGGGTGGAGAGGAGAGGGGGGGSLAAGTQLRILPFGDSITAGDGSTSKCGYRGDLVNALSGFTVEMVGSMTGGSCSNNKHAGYGGQTIQYLSGTVTQNLATQPNIILLMVGTNDMNPSSEYAKQGNDPTAASQRYDALLSSIFQSAPKVVVLAAKIVGSGGDTERQTRDDTFNGLIAGVCQQHASQGHHCVVVDMSVINTGTGLSSDSTHPDDSGYQKIASIWATAIKGLDSSWIQPASSTSGVETFRRSRRRRAMIE